MCFSLHGGGGWGRVCITRMHYLPNILTLSRIALVVVFTIALALDGTPSQLCNEVSGGWFSPLGAGACVALWAFVVGAVTDFFDGHLARKWNVVTDFGKLIDPLADKILVGAAFVYLSSVGVCPFWITILIIFREFLVTGLRQLAAARPHHGSGLVRQVENRVPAGVLHRLHGAPFLRRQPAGAAVQHEHRCGRRVDPRHLPGRGRAAHPLERRQLLHPGPEIPLTPPLLILIPLQRGEDGSECFFWPPIKSGTAREFSSPPGRMPCGLES